jgi:hypothetical protein
VNRKTVPVEIQGFNSSPILNLDERETILSDEEYALMRMKAEEERRLAQEESESASQELTRA